MIKEFVLTNITKHVCTGYFSKHAKEIKDKAYIEQDH